MTTIVGTVTAELRQCRRCGWWSHWRTAEGLCGNCVVGWSHCVRHGRLEWAASADPPDGDGNHRRVSVLDVLAAPVLRDTAPP